METKFTTVFTRTRNLSVYTELHQSSPHPSYLLKTHLILSFHLALGLPSGLFPSGFPTKT